MTRAFATRYFDVPFWVMISAPGKSSITSISRWSALFSALDEERDYFVNRAFEKMWAAITPQKFNHFLDLKSILRYLQICVHSVLVDAMRAHEQAELLEDTPQQSARLKDPTSPFSIEDQVAHKVQARQLWDLLDRRCKSEQERLVINGSFVLAFKASELYAANQSVFQDVNEVYRVKENLLARLKRDAEFMDFLESIQ
jgi:hypothetical protein